MVIIFSPFVCVGSETCILGVVLIGHSKLTKGVDYVSLYDELVTCLASPDVAEIGSGNP